MTSELHPETGTTLYTYFDDGLLASRTNARNITATYSYDDIGRPLTINYNDGITPSLAYEYDQGDFEGFLTSVDVVGVTQSTFAYDKLGNLSQENVTIDGIATRTAAYTYDLGGRLSTVTYPSGRVVTQTYKSENGFSNNRLLTLTDSQTSATLVGSVTVNAAGAVTERVLHNDVIRETRDFNSRNQLTHIGASASSTTFLDMGYGYGTSNNIGKIRSRTDAVQPEHSTNYSFDEIGRLTAAAGANWGISWNLDRYGNRLSQTPSGLAIGRVGSPSLAYANNKVTATSMQYDAAGNVIYDGTGHYTYDGENRLIQINSDQIQYAYDYAGRRISRKVGSVTTYYFYGLTGLMSEFSTESGSDSTSSDRLEYRIGEQTGTAVLLVDASGTPRENNRVFPFGEPWLAFAGSNNTEKFTTYQRDDANGEAGLDYAMARYYASKSGRFMTPDPGHVGADPENPQTWNAYAYSFNDPVNFTDPTGLCPPADDNKEDCSTSGGLLGWLGGLFGGGEWGPGSPLGLGPCFDPELARDCPQPFSGVLDQGVPTKEPATPDHRKVIADARLRVNTRLEFHKGCADIIGFKNGKDAVARLNAISIGMGNGRQASRGARAYYQPSSLFFGPNIVLDDRIDWTTLALRGSKSGSITSEIMTTAATNTLRQGEAIEFVILHEYWHSTGMKHDAPGGFDQYNRVLWDKCFRH